MHVIIPFSISEFLRDFWQQKPCLIKSGQLILPAIDFDQHDLAGLAQEDEVDSRIITHQPATNTWQLNHGPFEDFTPYCQDNWTLLVQGIDRYFEAASQLIEMFNFIPYWRMDDVMASFSVPGAGVGPHVDQYDVFLLNQSGERRWRVGKPNSNVTLVPTNGLQQVPAFDAIIDEVLVPGDILYIPPGWPHEGVTLTDCLTLSVGFRAPDVADIAATIETSTLQSKHEGEKCARYTDAKLRLREHPSIVTKQEVTRLRQMLIEQLHQNKWQQALMRLLSQQQLPDCEDEAQIRADITIDDVTQALQCGARLSKVFGCRPLFMDPTEAGETLTGNFQFYIDGDDYTVCHSCKTELVRLFAGDTLDGRDILEHKARTQLLECITTLIHAGVVLIED